MFKSEFVGLVLRRINAKFIPFRRLAKLKKIALDFAER
jgi:hypothetical protein